MKTSSLGCLSRTGIFAAVVTLIILGGFTLAGNGMLFSPGGLNAKRGAAPLGGVYSHADLGGNCAACHPAPWSQLTMGDLCLNCHQDVRAQLQAPHSLHAVMMAGKISVPCYSCHPDHRGPNAPLTMGDMTNFPHQDVGYSLQAHQLLTIQPALTCVSCHPQSLATFVVSTCATCHSKINATFMSAHLTAFGPACLACHDGVDSYGKNFNHNTRPFPLTGKHATLDCAQCHVGQTTLVALKATPQTCYACHAKNDAHQGELGQDCAACHTTTAWSPANFDHSKGPFPLTGKHLQVACTACHPNALFAQTSTDCYACHAKDDAHKGQFGTDCSLCHTTSGWLPSTFDHNKSAFPLTGAHASLACTSCHAGNKFIGLPTTCVGCHADPAYHAGMFGTNCASCHNTSAWIPATFNGPHTFPMNHGGAGSCQSCHPNTLAGWTCYTCHNQADMISRHAQEGITNISNCISCHANGRSEGGGGGGGN